MRYGKVDRLFMDKLKSDTPLFFTIVATGW